MKLYLFAVYIVLILLLNTFCERSEVSRGNANVLSVNSGANGVTSFSGGLCDLLTNANDFDGKEVEINTILITGREATYLYDPTCRGRQENEVWYEIEDSNESQKLDSIINSENPEFKEVGLIRVRADFRGIFMTKKDKGFGHLGDYRYNLRIQKIDNISPVAKDVPYPWQ